MPFALPENVNLYKRMDSLSVIKETHENIAGDVGAKHNVKTLS